MYSESRNKANLLITDIYYISYIDIKAAVFITSKETVFQVPARHHNPQPIRHTTPGVRTKVRFIGTG